MQNKGLIKLFAILFGLVSVYSLSFTFFADKVEDEAHSYAVSKAKNLREIAKYERVYLDSVANLPGVLGFGSFTYNDLKNKEINLGLDLKGGINATLEVSVKDILISLSNESKNPVFNKALDAATLAQRNSSENFLDLFYKEFQKIAGNTKLSDPTIFGTKQLREQINYKTTDKEVKAVLAKEIDASIATAFQVLRSRIDKFGVTQPNIQREGTSGRILIELPGAKDIERVKKLLQSTAELQFWEVYSGQELVPFLMQANEKVAELSAAQQKSAPKVAKKAAKSEVDDLLGDVKETPAAAAAPKKVGLFTYLQPTGQQTSVIGYAMVKDTANVNMYLNHPAVKALIPSELTNVQFMWDAKSNKDIISLYAIKSNRDNKAPIEGDVISDATQTFNELGTNPEVSMSMNANGSKLWAKMTAENVGKFVAVVLDNYVYTAPVVNQAITGGNTSISGNFTLEEATDLANVLKAGKLPAPAHIIQSEVVGPSLGQEAITASMISFGVALLLILAWTIFYYGRAGWYANVAIFINMLYMFGVLTSYGAVLTLPGIAGIILTIGMAVDANVIIYERIKELIAAGKDLRSAIAVGFSEEGAMSAIVDANAAALLGGGILYVFGTGPIQGFAFTFILGIFTSLFTAVFLTRLMLERACDKNKTTTFTTAATKGFLTNVHINFLKKRKLAYVLSSLVLIIGFASLATNGLDYGVDFVGGRTYTVKFTKPVSVEGVSKSLKEAFGSPAEVKTYGSSNQLKITTKYLIEKQGVEIDLKVQQALYKGLQAYLPKGTTLEKFAGGYEKQNIGIMSYSKVEPTIADDIKQSAVIAVLLSLVGIFLYILLRFRKVPYSLGAVIAVFHDVLITVVVFSLTYKFMPFTMEVDQSFIAALLTILGYSINDTVVIFDRVRESIAKTRTTESSFATIVNEGLSSTLSRTLNTAFVTLIILLAIFFFGGESMKGFMFALIIGVLVGTYSSLYIATPIMYDTLKKETEKDQQ